MSIIKEFVNDKEAFDILNDEKELNKVLLILQESSDSYLREIRERVATNTVSNKKEVDEMLDLAEGIIKAERKIREQQIYNGIALKSKGNSLITCI